VAVLVYDYTQGSDPNATWNNEQNAWDQVNNTYASRSAAAGENNEANRIEGTGHNAPPLNPVPDEEIVKVEIGVEGYDASGSLRFQMRPVFGGVAGASVYAVDPPGSDGDTTQYVDVTNDGNAPSPWTWDDILALDMRLWLRNTDSKNAHTGYVDQFRIRVTTQAPVVGYQYSNGLVSVGLVALLRNIVLGVCGKEMRVT
jgi:hypothetical protein